jgi:alcohol dehydrogenase (cytochrome c)
VLYRDSKIRDVVAFGGKDGFVTAIDRDTRSVLFRTPVTVIVDAPTLPTREGVRTCPGFAGGVEWNGPALDQLNNALITGAVDACFIIKLGDAKYSPTEVNFGGTVEPVGPVTGWVTALDAETGQVRWKYHAEKPVVAGVTPTAGGVTFTGDLAGNLLVFNSKTGDLLRKIQTGGSLAGGVVTYEMDGKQYVAFASGNVSANAFGALGVPSVVVMALNPAGAASTQVAAALNQSGRRLFGQVCASCHGSDGNMIAGHRLSTQKERGDVAATIRYIKDPKAPMPKMFPGLITDQNVVDVATYLHNELAR